MNNPNSANTQSPESQPTENKGIPKQPLPIVAPPTETHITQPKSKATLGKVPVWRFLIAMMIQATLIVAVPFKSAITYANGQTVTLRTLPVDPYDLLRGYSQTLRFEISDLERLKQLPGAGSVFTETENQRNYNYSAPLFVTLEAPTDARAEGKIPTAWEPVAVSTDYPENLQDNQVALKGHVDRWRVVYGLETYYMPEAQRDDINEKISTEQQTEEGAFVVDVKIDGDGQSVPMSLWVRNEEFRF